MLGILTFRAPFLPWVLIAFNVVINGHWPKDELCGIAVGHGMFYKPTVVQSERFTNMVAVWYFFNDIYPSTHSGYRPMDPPGWWIRLFERQPQGEGETDVDVHAAALNRDVGAPAMDVR